MLIQNQLDTQTIQKGYPRRLIPTNVCDVIWGSVDADGGTKEHS
jgi:hypothetical protein